MTRPPNEGWWEYRVCGSASLCSVKRRRDPSPQEIVISHIAIADKYSLIPAPVVQGARSGESSLHQAFNAFERQHQAKRYANL